MTTQRLRLLELVRTLFLAFLLHPSPLPYASALSSDARGRATGNAATSASNSNPATTASVSSTRAPGTEGLAVFPRAFTPTECDRIVRQFHDDRPSQRDVRIHDAVSRTNYFDHDPRASDRYDWIFDRIVKCLAEAASDEDENGNVLDARLWGLDPKTLKSASDFAAHVDFVLLHEFNDGDFFDWHVDTKPHDKTGRTVNVNVMLSDPGDYDGGELEVGTYRMKSGRGDLTFYPASLPHRVEDVTRGTRHTLVINIRVSDESKSDDVRKTSGYWDLAASNHAILRERKGNIPKIHMVRGEWHVAGGDEESADDAFAEGYRSTPEAKDYAKHFNEEGLKLYSAGNLKAALGSFIMAARVDPDGTVYARNRDATMEALGKGGAE